MRIILTDLEWKSEFSATIEAFVGLYDQFEVEEVVGIREFCFAGLGQLELVDVFRDSELKSKILLPINHKQS